MIVVAHTCTALMLAKDGLTDSRRRAGYLMVTVAITVAAWLALSAMSAPFVGGSASKGSGVTVRNGNQSNAPLPLRYARRIEAVQGARDVTWLALQIVNCKTSPSVSVTLNAYGGPGALAQVKQKHAEPAAIKRWKHDPLGILITSQTAADCGWDVGQGVEPPDMTGMKHVPLHVSGTFRGSGDIAYAHFDYINRIDPLFGKDKVLFYLASGVNGRGDELLAARIEAEFAHDFPTVSATTNTTAQNAWARFGKVQLLLGFVMAAILLCAASVLISVLAHAATQRRSKFALLQVLGFHRATLFSAFALELLVIVVMGALLGTGIGTLLAHALAPTPIGVFSGGFTIPVWAYAWMPLWLFALAAVSLVWPAALVARVRPADYRAI